MITLNDKINLTLSFSASSSSRYENYYVTYTDKANAFYVGRVFVPASSTTTNITVYLTDILKSEIDNKNYLDPANNGMEKAPIVIRFRVMTNSVTYGYLTVLMAYKYLFANYSNNHIYSDTQLTNDSQRKKSLVLPLLGCNYSLSDQKALSYTLYPRYPKFGINNPDNFNFIQRFLIGNDINDVSLCTISGDSRYYIDGISVKGSLVMYSEPLETLLDDVNYCVDGIGMTSAKAFGATTVITGKKLNVVEIMADSSDSQRWNQLLLFFQDLGYDDFFMHKCYVIDESTQLKQYFLVYEGETNKATRLIAEKYPLLLNWYIGTTENVASVNNWYLRYRLTDMHTIADRNERYNFTLFLTEFFPVDEEYVETVWDINESRTSDIVDLPLPYILYDDNALETIRYHFEEGFESMEGYCYDDFFDADSGQDAGTTYPSTYKEESVPNIVKIADIDNDPAPFYLQWFDRYGGVQCQPFNGKIIKNVNYSVLNIKNMYGESRPVSYSNTYQFLINSGWLSDDILPLYESIFVSPYLRLYDTKNKLGYTVIIEDKTFTEKTHKNQNKMFGIDLKLSINNTENILY